MRVRNSDPVTRDRPASVHSAYKRVRQTNKHKEQTGWVYRNESRSVTSVTSAGHREIAHSNRDASAQSPTCARICQHAACSYTNRGTHKQQCGSHTCKMYSMAGRTSRGSFALSQLGVSTFLRIIFANRDACIVAYRVASSCSGATTQHQHRGPQTRTAIRMSTRTHLGRVAESHQQITGAQVRKCALRLDG